MNSAIAQVRLLQSRLTGSQGFEAPDISRSSKSLVVRNSHVEEDDDAVAETEVPIASI